MTAGKFSEENSDWVCPIVGFEISTLHITTSGLSPATCGLYNAHVHYKTIAQGAPCLNDFF